MSLQDVREKLLKDRKPSSLVPSVIGENAILVDMYDLSKNLPQSPSSGNQYVNDFVQLQGRLTILGCYDWLKEATDLSRPSEKAEIIQIFKCVRDAAAHNNQFQIRDEKIRKNFPL